MTSSNLLFQKSNDNFYYDIFLINEDNDDSSDLPQKNFALLPNAFDKAFVMYDQQDHEGIVFIDSFPTSPSRTFYRLVYQVPPHHRIIHSNSKSHYKVFFPYEFYFFKISKTTTKTKSFFKMDNFLYAWSTQSLNENSIFFHPRMKNIWSNQPSRNICMGEGESETMKTYSTISEVIKVFIDSFHHTIFNNDLNTLVSRYQTFQLEQKTHLKNSYSNNPYLFNNYMSLHEDWSQASINVTLKHFLNPSYLIPFFPWNKNKQFFSKFKSDHYSYSKSIVNNKYLLSTHDILSKFFNPSISFYPV